MVMATNVPNSGTAVKMVEPWLFTDSRARPGHIAGMGNNLKALRTKRGWTQTQAAEAMGTTRDMYTKLENGSRRLNSSWLAAAGSAFEVDPGQIVAERDQVPLVGYVGAGAEAHYHGKLADEVDAPEDATENTVAVEVRGDSLGTFFDRWLIFYDDVRRPVTPDLVGPLCVVGLPDGRVLVKKIKPSRNRGLYHLFGQFGDPILDTPIDWAAKVKRMQQR